MVTKTAKEPDVCRRSRQADFRCRSGRTGCVADIKTAAVSYRRPQEFRDILEQSAIKNIGTFERERERETGKERGTQSQFVLFA